MQARFLFCSSGIPYLHNSLFIPFAANWAAREYVFILQPPFLVLPLRIRVRFILTFILQIDQTAWVWPTKVALNLFPHISSNDCLIGVLVTSTWPTKSFLGNYGCRVNVCFASRFASAFLLFRVTRSSHQFLFLQTRPPPVIPSCSRLVLRLLGFVLQFINCRVIFQGCRQQLASLAFANLRPTKISSTTLFVTDGCIAHKRVPLESIILRDVPRGVCCRHVSNILSRTCSWQHSRIYCITK